MPNNRQSGASAANSQQRIAGWRGHSPGQLGVNLAYGVGNPPPGGLGGSYVSGMPVGKLPPNRYLGGQPPGATGDGVPGRKDSRASGNPDVSTSPVNRPLAPYGGNSGYGLSQFGVSRPLNVGQESWWRGGAFYANDKLSTHDRHAELSTGIELSGRRSGNTDPPLDGPARPSLRTVQRSINYQQGTDTTRDQDDLSRPYARTPDGKYFLGTQGDTWSPVYGGTPGLFQPYGTYAGIGNVPNQGIQSPVEQGSPGDGPQSFRPGPPHGLHSPTLPPYSQTLGYYLASPQMRPPRQDRPSNSTIAGQSYSQTVQSQAATAKDTVIGSKTPVGGTYWATRKVSGWRGQAGNANGNQ